MITFHSFVLTLGFLSVPLLALVVAYVFSGRRWGRWMRVRNVALGTCVSLLSLWMLLLIFELGFKLFVIQSDGFGHTLAAQRWFEKYWGPTNSFGFRDREFSETDLASTEKLFVVGDSFVAGLGINDPEERFSNHLRRWLAPDWSVCNLGRMGWNTRQELDAIRSFPIKPDLVVWSYYINDIENAAAEQGRTPYVDLKIQCLSAKCTHEFPVV